MSAQDQERLDKSQRPRVTPTTIQPTSKENAQVIAGSVQEAASNNWSHLLRWEQDDNSQEIIDWRGLGDVSDGEEGEARVEAMDGDEEEEEALVSRESARAGKLSPEQVIEIINERIEHFTQQWRPGKGEDAQHQPDPVQLWEDAQAEGRREHMVEQKNSEIAYYRARLDQLSEEILKEQCNTVGEVRLVCRNLETTVDLLEEADWLLGIYMLEPEDEDEDEGHQSGDAGPTTGENSRLPHHDRVELIEIDSGSEPDPDKMLLDSEDYAAEATAKATASTTVARRLSTPGSKVDDSVGAGAIRATHQRLGPPVSSNPGTIRHGRHPESASIHAVSQWDMGELVAKADRKRIVMKVVHGMGAEDRELIRTRVMLVQKKDLLMEISPCVNMWCRKETKMRGVLPKDTHKIVTFTKLFLCWWLSGDYFSEERIADWRMKEVAGNLEMGCPDLEYFYDWLRHILTNTFSEDALRTPKKPSQAEIVVISDDED